MGKTNFMIPRDAGGEAPDGTIWTGEIQAISYTNVSTSATQVTVPGPWYKIYSTTGAHVVFGGKTDLRPATATGADTCFPIPVNGWTDPIYIPDSFRNPATGTGSLYVRAIRSASSNGVLYIAQAFPSPSSRTSSSVVWPTSSSTTTTT